MNKQTGIMSFLALMLMAIAGLGMHALKTHHRLGAPGIKTTFIPGSERLAVYLPADVLDYGSAVVPTDTNVLEGLPHDTSFACRRFISPDKSDAQLVNIVLMGTDRTSIHKPQFCLTGSGWNIDDSESFTDTVRVESPHPYDLPVMKLLTTRLTKKEDGETVRIRGIYVYWFVADHELTASHWIRIRNTTTHLLSTGELERWAYVSFFDACWPGQEEATYERMKKLIAASVPRFQLVSGPQVASRGADQTASR